MTIGHGKTLMLMISGPTEMWPMHLELKKMNLFTGVNGVGKSLVMKIVWVLNMIANLVVVKAPKIKEGAQFIMDHSIPDNGILGSMTLAFETGAVIQVEMLKGKIMSVESENMQGITEPINAIYMSSNMRTFNSITQYLTIKKDLGQEAMLKHYRLYDVLYVERLVSRMPITFDKTVRSSLHTFGIEHLASIEYKDCDFIGIYDDGKRRSLCMEGSGHQALINMLLGGIK